MNIRSLVSAFSFVAYISYNDQIINHLKADEDNIPIFIYISYNDQIINQKKQLYNYNVI